MLISGTAISQTTFSFANLTWGDSVEVVDLKLKKAGFTGCGQKEKLVCRVHASCDCRFTGSGISSGMVAFTDSKLGKVAVELIDWRATFDILVKKYGQPRSGNASYVSPFEDKDTPIIWTSPSNDSMEISKKANLLIYKSGVENQKAQAQDQTNKSIF